MFLVALVSLWGVRVSLWGVGVSSSEVEVEQEEEESKRSLESWKKQDSVSSSSWSWSTASWVMAYGAFPFGSTNPKKEMGMGRIVKRIYVRGRVRNAVRKSLFWSELDPMNGAVRM